MFGKISVLDELNIERQKGENLISPQIDELDAYQELEEKSAEKDSNIVNVLKKKKCGENNIFDFDKLETDRIYHISAIKTICWKYNLRFLPSGYFVNEFPKEALDELKHLTNTGTFDFRNLQIIAPAKLFQLEDANEDPLLMAPMGNGYYYLIHKWGNDLTWYRAILSYPFRDFMSLFKSLFVLVLFLALITPNFIITTNPDLGYFNIYRLLLLPYLMVLFGGIIAYFSFAFSKNFADTTWNSKTFN
ncbi:MAG: hypothetical protein ACXITV_08370 [Luteibaculaceae bacterium]